MISQKSTLPIATVLVLVFISCNTTGPSSEEKTETSAEILCASPSKADAVSSAYINVQEKNTEEYSHQSEEGFKSVLHQPYSTFAIDVDAASYSIMRKKVLSGTLPPPEEVRIEEWINYFQYNYPQPGIGKPFSLVTEYAECPWNKAHKLLHIGIKGEEVQQQSKKNNNLVFLIDVSGSMMDADKLPLIKRAFKLLVPQLQQEDKLSLIVYAGAAGVVLHGVKGKNKLEILEAIEKLEAGGSTAGGEGIELAYKIAREHFIKNGNNRIILTTDGDFNVGKSNLTELEAFIAEKRASGVYLSVLGFGEGNIKDNTMETLADKGNGNYYYIDNILEAKKVLVKQLGGTINTISRDVKIQVEFNPKYVKEYRLIGYDNRKLEAEDFNDDKKDAGELGSGHTVTALYEIVETGNKETNVKIDPLKYQATNRTVLPSSDLANIKFRYKLPEKNDSVSKLITTSIKPTATNLKNSSANFKLAVAVTEFALVMQNSKYKAKANLEEAIELAHQARENDEEGYVNELIHLMQTSNELMEDNNLPNNKE